MNLKHITFTGIDEKTDIQTLQEIQEKYPIAEFGILTSYNWAENGNRYPDPYIIAGLPQKGLNLSLHACGRIAHDASTGEWGKLEVQTVGCLAIFNRIQLNISTRSNNPEYCAPARYSFQEIIVQQKNVENIQLFEKTVEEHPDYKFSVLLDASGGEGKDTPVVPLLKNYYKVGYAGGINPDNVGEKLSYILEQPYDGDFWIDMETGVRTDDWFDVNKVVKVLEICDNILKK